MVQFDKEASQTRDFLVRKERLLGMTIKLHHYPNIPQPCEKNAEILRWESFVNERLRFSG